MSKFVTFKAADAEKVGATGTWPEPWGEEWLDGCRAMRVFISRGHCIDPEKPITYTDVELVSTDEETGAMTFKYGEATNEV